MSQNTTPAEAVRLNSQGMIALRAGRFAEAERLFLAATGHDALASSLWLNVATARRAQGDDAGELQALNAAIDCDGRDFTGWLRKAQLYQRTGENSEALAAWSGVLQLAAQIDNLSSEVNSALQVGRDFVSKARERISEAVGSHLPRLQFSMDETEFRRSTAFVDLALGQRRAYNNECEGLYYPFLPADEFFDRRHFNWMPDIEAVTADIRTELENLLLDPNDELRPYVRMNKGLPENKWTGLDHSLDWGACFLWEYGQPNQPVLDRCPKTAEALGKLPLAKIPGRSPSAFFSILKPKTRIPPHTGVTNTRAIIHLPLIVPAECGFRVGGEVREWREGIAFGFDDTIEHEAWNNSEEMRAVLIFDVWNPHLTISEQRLISGYFEAADQSGFNPAR